MKKFLALNFSDDVFSMLINVKMPTIVGILTFMSRIISCSSQLSMEKSFITSGLTFAVCYSDMHFVNSSPENQHFI